MATPGLMAMLCGMLAFLVAVFAYSAWRDHQATLESGWQSAERGALGAAEHARRTLSVARLLTKAVVQDVRRDGFEQFRAEGWEDVAQLARTIPEVTVLWLTDAQGMVVASSTSREAPRVDWSARAFFKPLRDGADSVLMPLTWGMINRNWYLSYSMALRDGTGRFLGIVQSSLTTSDIGRAYAELELPQGAGAWVFRAGDGAPIILWPAPPPADRSMPAPQPAESDILARHLARDAAASGRVEFEGRDGPMVMAWRRFDGGEPLVAAMTMRRDTVLAPYHERLRRKVLSLLAAVLPIGALGWVTIGAQRRGARSEARFRSTFEQAAVGVAHVGLDGRWLRANQRLCAMLGYDEPELRQRTVLDVVHPEDRAELEAMQARLHGGTIERFSLRRRFLCKDGTLLWGELTGSLLRDEATGRALHGVAVIQDIGARVAAEAALAASERRLALACEVVGLGVFDVDTESGFATVNAEWRRLYGLPPSDAPISLEERLASAHPDDRARVRAETLRAYATHGSYDLEFRIVRRDTGEVRWMHSRGAFVDSGPRRRRFLGLIHDVTARHAAEVALAESEERLALASASAGMGVFDVDTRTGLAVVSAQWRSLYGLPPGEEPVEFEARMALIEPEDREQVRVAVRTAWKDRSPYAVEFRIRRKDTGELRWLTARGSYVGSEPGKVRFLGVAYDITERKREQERETLLAREVDHRARNVLAVVRSIVKLSRADDPRQFAEAVEGRVAALARAHTLLARDRWTGAELADVLREELAAYATAEPAGGADARVTFDGPPIRLRPDVVQPLSMVLHELATNAAKYGALSTEGGRVALSWRLEPPQPGEDEPGGRIVLAWHEQGGPDLAGPPARRGFGSMVVEATVRSQLGGEVARIWAGDGLHCEIIVPADRAIAAAEEQVRAEPLGQQAAAPSGPSGSALRGRRVLVVEDEPIVALEVAATLAEAGCEVVGPAASLDEALELAEAQAGQLDAAVLDANLHGQSSRPVADILTARGVPVIYVTGYSSLPPGAADGLHLLSKPLRDGDLLGALRHVLQAEATRELTAL
jgi:PAS domain S-box-containing protein